MSHNRMKNFFQKFGAEPYTRMYKKKQLMTICRAYGIQFTSRENKSSLTSKLLPVLMSSDLADIPHPYFLNFYRAQAIVDDNAHRVVLRLSRQRSLSKC